MAELAPPTDAALQSELQDINRVDDLLGLEHGSFELIKLLECGYIRGRWLRLQSIFGQVKRS